MKYFVSRVLKRLLDFFCGFFLENYANSALHGWELYVLIKKFGWESLYTYRIIVMSKKRFVTFGSIFREVYIFPLARPPFHKMLGS